MQLDSKRVYYKTAQGKVKHGIYDAIAGTVGGKAKPNPRGIYATLLRAEILLSISDLGVRYLFRSGLTSPLLVRGPH
eukprot:COSAG06_NODE_42644_length_379_cov_5.614286_1_plen_76_part_10